MAVQLTEPSAKRQRSSTHSALPAPGEDSCEFLAERQLILRHGTSLQLMALVGTALNESSEFEAIDPEEDWQKWQARRPDFSLYYAALVDPARDGADSVLCVLRAVLDGVPEPTPPHRSRMIIDYVTTRPVARGRGLASHLVNFVVDAATAFGANVYVSAVRLEPVTRRSVSHMFAPVPGRCSPRRTAACTGWALASHLKAVRT